MGDAVLQEPGQMIRPRGLSDVTINETISRLYGLHVTSCTELPSYDDRNYHVTVDGTCNNKHIARVVPAGYVFKVLNTRDSKNLDYMVGMTRLLQHINSGGLRVSEPQPNKDGVFYSPETFTHGQEQEECLVRLFDFIPGKILQRVPYEPRLCYNVGKYVGKMDSILQKFHDKFYDRHQTVWSLSSVPGLIHQVHLLPDKTDREIVTQVITAFRDEVVPAYDRLQPGIIHGDANEQNILVDRVGDHYDVTAMIDAGDATKSYVVFELGILIAYIMIDSGVIDSLDVGGHVLAGYQTEVELNATELDILRVLVASRLVQSLVMGLAAYSSQPWNEYLLTTSNKGWPCLRKLWRCGKAELYGRWAHVVALYENNR